MDESPAANSPETQTEKQLENVIENHEKTAKSKRIPSKKGSGTSRKTKISPEAASANHTPPVTSGNTSKSSTGKKKKSAKSRSSSRGAGTKSSREAKREHSSKTGSKGRSKEETVGESGTTTDIDTDEDVKTFKKCVLPDTLPENCVSLYLSGNTQRLFNLVVDEHVDELKPYKLIKKADILQDFYNRAAVSDFSVVRRTIENYPEDDILVGYDAEFKFGNNFFMATTEEAKLFLLTTNEKEDDENEKQRSLTEEDGFLMDEEDVAHYIPPKSKPWVSQGSQVEIMEWQAQQVRPKIRVTVSRKRRHFGRPIVFAHRNATDPKQGYFGLDDYEDNAFNINIMEMDQSVDNTPMISHKGIQTTYKWSKNASTQYQHRILSLEQINDHLYGNNGKLSVALKTIIDRYVIMGLRANEVFDLLYNDYDNLSISDEIFDPRADNTLKEYQSFTDLVYSKNKCVVAIQCPPTLHNIIAIATAEKLDYNARCEQYYRITLMPSYIVFWNFGDPIQPQLLLLAPDDILCFQFCPSQAHIIAGGCINGQVVLWDISKHMDYLKNVKTCVKNDPLHLVGFDDEAEPAIPIMRFCALSAIDGGHTAAITDLQWLPDHFELNKLGYVMENKLQKCHQLLTCASDHSVLLWDIRNPKVLGTSAGGPGIGPIKSQHSAGSYTALTNFDTIDEEAEAPKSLSNIPETFKHLDLTWKPVLRMHLHKIEAGGDHAPVKFSIRETQGDRSAVQLAMQKQDQHPSGIPGSGKEMTLNTIKTIFYVGTEDGELVYLDWMPKKDQESGKLQTEKPEFYTCVHDGPILFLDRCPFDRNLLLAVGGWCWSLWREEEHPNPILMSNTSAKQLTSAAWSQSRPSVFYIGRSDGNIEVWDLLDKTHVPCAIQSISSMAITCMSIFNAGKQQLLSAGDTGGVLHVYKVPWRLRNPLHNEAANMKIYVDRETKRRRFVKQRWNLREQEKIEQELETKRKAGIAPLVVLTEEERIMRMQLEYNRYTEEENTYLRSIGQREDDDMFLKVAT